MNTLPKRKSLRLKDYNYSSEGAYFVTICTYNKKCTLSHIRRDDPCGRPLIELTELGKIADEAVTSIEIRYKITVSDCIIMPNHIHMIVFIPEKRTGGKPRPYVIENNRLVQINHSRRLLKPMQIKGKGNGVFVAK